MSTLAHLALRAHALAIVVCTTGATTLSATSTGYARTTGSFITDGFYVGMEVTPSGFTQTARGVVVSVSDLTLGIAGGRTVQSAGAGRSLSVGMPSVRMFGNLEPVEDGVSLPEPIVGRPYLREEFAPSTQRLTTNTQNGVIAHTGLYLLTWAGLSNTEDIGIRKCADAVMLAFQPMRGFTLTDGSTLRIRGDVAPWARQISQRTGGWAPCVITIPWQLTTRRA